MEYIYKNELPFFKDYEIINENESIFSKLNIKKIPIFSFYIKGIDKDIDNNTVNKVDADKYFNDYIELGKNLFNIIFEDGEIEFEHNYKMSPIRLKSIYVEKNYMKLIKNMQDEETIELYNNIDELINIDLSYYLKKDERIFKIIKLIDNLFNTIIILTISDIKFDTYIYFKELETMIYDFINLCETYEKKINIDDELIEFKELIDFYIKDLNKTIKSNDIDFKHELIISQSKNVDNIEKKDIYNKEMEPLLKILIHSSKIKEMEQTLISWLKEYGFPYFVKNEDINLYHNFVKKQLNLHLEENEEIIPCEKLINHSIYSYMVFSLLKDWKQTDKRIKILFNFNDNSLRESKNRVRDIREMVSYYNKNSEIYGFKTTTTEKIKRRANSDNRFIDFTEYDPTEFIFHDLCLAVNKLILEYDEILSEDNEYKKKMYHQKQCIICNRWFSTKNGSRKYCSTECSTIGERKKDSELKKRKRDEKKKNKPAELILMEKIFGKKAIKKEK